MTRSIPYDINEGDGAFYGPKIDVKLKDAIGRKWQCATIQVDFALPERFDLHYADSDGKRKRPVMLHRVVLGAIERFMGVLIEHYAGRFPCGCRPFRSSFSLLPTTGCVCGRAQGHASGKHDMRVEVDTETKSSA